MATGDNLEHLYNKKKYGLEKNLLKNYSNNIGINLDNANDEYYSNYKTYNDFNKIKALKNDEFDNNININNKINNDINNNYYENKYIKETNMNNNNNLYEIKTANNLNKNNTNIYDYKKNYSIKNGELNLEIKNLDLNKINREENDGQRYSSEKRNYRLKELKLNRNYGNNLDGNNIYLGKNNYNYDLNNINGIKDDRMNYTSGTGGFI